VTTPTEARHPFSTGGVPIRRPNAPSHLGPESLVAKVSAL
jgi:hypothetical protein